MRINNSSEEFLDRHIRIEVKKFVDDPILGVDAGWQKEVVDIYIELGCVCADLGFTFWNIAKDEGCGELELKRLARILVESETAGLDIPAEYLRK